MDKRIFSEKTGKVLDKEGQAALTPQQVQEDLRLGNERFAKGKLIRRDYLQQVKRTSRDQFPKAVVLSCIDSRVPVEIIFDQGIGDIFVARVAGNIENTEILGSFEFATAMAGAKLILVLGHTGCGAVIGAINQKQEKTESGQNLKPALEKIYPAIETTGYPDEERNPANPEFVGRVAEKNVHLTINRIRQKSNSIAEQEMEGKIKIIGGIYHINDGKVKWI